MGSVNLKISYGGAESLFSLTIWISYVQRFLYVQVGAKVTSEALI